MNSGISNQYGIELFSYLFQLVEYSESNTTMDNRTDLSILEKLYDVLSQVWSNLSQEQKAIVEINFKYIPGKILEII